MSHLAIARARIDPEGIAVIDAGTGRRLSWAELDAAAAAASVQLAAIGVRRGDRVAVAAPAGAEFAILLHGVLRAGASLMPLAPGARPAEAAPLLLACRPRVALAPAGEPLAALRTAARSTHPPRARPIVHDLAEVAAPRPAPADRPQAGRRPRLADEILVVQTSGTSGRPRAVRLTLGNQVASARGCAESLGLGPSDHWLLAMAPHRIGGLAVLVRSAVLGQPVTVLPRFDEAEVLAALGAGGPTVLPLVPTMLARLVAAGGTPRLRGLRAILLGGAAAPPADLAGWLASGIPACPSYGLTETGSQVATVPPGEAHRLGAAAGRPHRFARVRILPEDGSGRAVRRGRPGLVEVRGPVVSPGYVEPEPGGPGAGRFVTRDRGWLDPAGVLHLVGRVDDAILTGGETVQPEEVEAVLLRHPLVVDAAVVGVDDPLWGQRVEAFLVAPPGRADDARRLVPAACRLGLSGGRLPRAFHVVERLPRSEAGKLLRRELAGHARELAGDVRPAGR